MYGRVAEISLKEALAYRVEFFTGMIGNLVQLAVFWYVWKAIYAASSTPIAGISLAAMLTYMSVSVALRGLFYSESEFSIETEVKSGSIAAILIKPISYPLYCLSRQLGGSVLSLFSQVIPVVVIAIFVIGISTPAAPIAFAVSVFMGFIINWIMSWLTGMWALWSAGSIWGMSLARRIITEIMSGALIPIYFFPGWLATVANLLPFQAMFGTPLSIYIGMVTGPDIWIALGVQFLWTILFIGVAIFVWNRAQKKIFIQGG